MSINKLCIMCNKQMNISNGINNTSDEASNTKDPHNYHLHCWLEYQKNVYIDGYIQLNELNQESEDNKKKHFLIKLNATK